MNTHKDYNHAGADDTIKNSCPNPKDFDEFLPWACQQYSVETEVIVAKATEKSYVRAAGANVNKKQIQKPKPSKAASLETSVTYSGYIHSSILEKAVISNENKITIETIYNNNENLVHLNFLKNKTIPRKIMQIIALTIPYQKHLTSITINSGLHMDSVYEMSKFLPYSQIIELCLDDTFLCQANYHILLTHGKLKHLSLARCSINDAVVKTIADQLEDPCPAARVLSALNLSTNKITDIGAKYLADVLRSNRQLCYLNLAGNLITDDGGVSIFDTLQKFPLQPHELSKSRARYVDYLKKKNDLINAFVKELQTAAFDKNATRKKSPRKKLESQSMQHYGIDVESLNIQEKAEYLAERRLGLFDEAFALENTETQEGVVYCFGNNALCCLNVAYNNLTYVSVKKLLEVLTTQKSLCRTPKGLIKVVIEGNLMPVACEEFEEIDQILGSGIKVSYRKQVETATKKKPLSSRSVTITK